MPWGMAVEGLKPQSLLEGVPLHAMGDGCKGLESTEFACGGGAFKCHNACLYMPQGMANGGVKAQSLTVQGMPLHAMKDSCKGLESPELA